MADENFQLDQFKEGNGVEKEDREDEQNTEWQEATIAEQVIKGIQDEV